MMIAEGGSRPSDSATLMSVASPTTWLLVTMTPLGSTITPRAERGALTLLRSTEHAAAEGALEERVALERRLHLDARRCVDVDHGRRDTLHDRRERKADRLAALGRRPAASPPGRLSG